MEVLYISGKGIWDRRTHKGRKNLAISKHEKDETSVDLQRPFDLVHLI